jgi:anti-sigma factor RsiW
MCEYSGRLIAWLDRELPDQEATNVEWHVGQCAECRKAVSEYEDVSRAFLACYEASGDVVEPNSKVSAVDAERRGCGRGDGGGSPSRATSSRKAFIPSSLTGARTR